MKFAPSAPFSHGPFAHSRRLPVEHSSLAKRRLLSALGGGVLALGVSLGCQNSMAAPAPAAQAAAAPSDVAANRVAANPVAANPAAANPVAANPVAANPADTTAAALAETPVRSHIKAEGQLGPGAGVLLIDIGAPAGAKLTLDAPLSALASGGIGLGFPQGLSGPLGQHVLPLRIPILVADGATGPAQVELSYFWCTDGAEAACRRELAVLSVDLDLTGSAAGGEAHLSHNATAND